MLKIKVWHRTFILTIKPNQLAISTIYMLATYYYLYYCSYLIPNVMNASILRCLNLNDCLMEMRFLTFSTSKLPTLAVCTVPCEVD